MLGKEVETGGQHPIEFLPAIHRFTRGLFHPHEPVRHLHPEHLSMHSFFGFKVMQQTRTPDADLGGDDIERRAIEAVLGKLAEGHPQNCFPCSGPTTMHSSW